MALGIHGTRESGFDQDKATTSTISSSTATLATIVNKKCTQVSWLATRAHTHVCARAVVTSNAQA